MERYPGKVYIYLNRKWELVRVFDGEEFGPGFLDLSSGNKSEARVREEADRRIATGNLIEHSGYMRKLSGWESYWFLKEITEPEENEFGEVSP